MPDSIKTMEHCDEDTVLVNGVGSCSALGGTAHYQDIISMEKIIFLWRDTKNWGGTSLPCPPGSYTYGFGTYLVMKWMLKRVPQHPVQW